MPVKGRSWSMRKMTRFVSLTVGERATFIVTPAVRGKPG
jgi:hypothetical protein